MGVKFAYNNNALSPIASFVALRKKYQISYLPFHLVCGKINLWKYRLILVHVYCSHINLLCME